MKTDGLAAGGLQLAYGDLVPAPALTIPEHGWVNLHFSLLPAWRGAAPVQHAIWRGDDITGASTFALEAPGGWIIVDTGDSTRVAAASEVLNPSATLGLSTGISSRMSLDELDALRQRLAQLWSPPAGAKDPQELVVVFRIKLKPDGRMAPGPWPQLVASGNTPLAIAARESAARALNRGQPFDMLKPEHYEQWKDIEITFDPRDMFR